MCAQNVDNQKIFAAISKTSYTYNSYDGFGFYIDTTASYQRSRLYGRLSGNNLTDNMTPSNGNQYPLTCMSYTETSSGVMNSYINGNIGSSNNTNE